MGNVSEFRHHFPLLRTSAEAVTPVVLSHGQRDAVQQVVDTLTEALPGALAERDQQNS